MVKTPMIQIGNSTIRPGEIIPDGDIFSRYYLPDQERSLRAGHLITSMALNICRLTDFNFPANPNFMKAVLHDPEKRSFCAFDLDELYQGLDGTDNFSRSLVTSFEDDNYLQTVLVYAPNNQNKNYELTQPRFVNINFNNLMFLDRPDYLCINSPERKNLENIPDFLTVLETLTSKAMNGNLFDAVDELYGNLTDAEKIKLLLGGNTVIDQESREVLEILAPESGQKLEEGKVLAKRHDFDKSLNAANKKLRKNVFGEKFIYLPQRLFDHKYPKPSSIS